VGSEKERRFVGGSQASPARRSDKEYRESKNVRMIKSGDLRQRRGILIF
jgi:hypothetical protein